MILEAKRLFAHTLQPVSSVSRNLGFDEPTNLVKFFRSETALTPGTFRRQHVTLDHEISRDLPTQ